MDEFFNANKDLWDTKVDAHKDSEFYNLEGFLKGDLVAHTNQVSLCLR